MQTCLIAWRRRQVRPGRSWPSPDPLEAGHRRSDAGRSSMCHTIRRKFGAAVCSQESAGDSVGEARRGVAGEELGLLQHSLARLSDCCGNSSGVGAPARTGSSPSEVSRAGRPPLRLPGRSEWPRRAQRRARQPTRTSASCPRHVRSHPRRAASRPRPSTRRASLIAPGRAGPQAGPRRPGGPRSGSRPPRRRPCRER